MRIYGLKLCVVSASRCSDVKSMAERIPGWIEHLLLPRLSSLKGELKAFRGEVVGELKAVGERIESFEKQVSSLRNVMNASFEALEGKATLIEEVTGLD